MSIMLTFLATVRGGCVLQDAEVSAKLYSSCFSGSLLGAKEHVPLLGSCSGIASLPKYDQIMNDCLQERLQLIMSAQFAKQEAALKSRVAELEAKAAASGVTA